MSVILRRLSGICIDEQESQSKIRGRPDAIRSVDAVFAVKVMSAPCDPAAERLARLLGAAPRLALTSTIGGNSPQRLINKAAGIIARGELESVLIAGAETYYPRSGRASWSRSPISPGAPPLRLSSARH
jgi:acetyl-CoA C-acetyltransferase